MLTWQWLNRASPPAYYTGLSAYPPVPLLSPSISPLIAALSGGAIAVGAYNKGGGTPAGVRLVEAGAYCTNATGVDNHSSFGYTLATCAHAVATSPRCLHGKDPHALFYYSEGYNGQCTCTVDPTHVTVSGPCYSF